MGLRYRIKSKVAGRPDMVFPSKRVAVFVDGCQWHCCPEHWVRPKSNTEFWDEKFEKNRRRDSMVNELLGANGWTVLRFWEHDVKRNKDRVASRIVKAVKARE
jgi:DNA mismatch endonuclease (patch repair protein)